MACKKDSKPANSNEKTDNKRSTDSSLSTQYPSLDPAFQSMAQTQKINLMLTDSIWHFYAGVNLREPKPTLYKGDWLDLKEGGDYSRGVFDQTTDEGKYVYDDKSTILELRSSRRDSASAWRVKVDPGALLIIGTEKYKNNPWQIKLNRSSGLPIAK